MNIEKILQKDEDSMEKKEHVDKLFEDNSFNNSYDKQIGNLSNMSLEE